MADYQQKRDFMKKFFKTIIPIIVIAVALILFLNWANKTEKYECEIEEIQIVKKRIEGGANEKAVLRLFINCPFVCINFDFFWLNKARQLYMDF